MKNSIILFVLGIAILIYGTFAGERHVFPYPQIIAIKNLLKGETPKQINYFYEQKRSHYAALDKNSTASIVMLGDSLTDRGEWQELLKTNDVINRGIDSDTTKGILHRINTLSPSVQKVFIMVGTNDFNANKSVDEVYKNYKKIISILRSKSITVYVQSTLLHTHLRSSALNPHTNELNHLLQIYCQKNNIIFIDLNKHLSNNGQLNNAYTIDGTHLNGEGYTLWTKIILPISKKN